LLFMIVGAIGEFEREIIVERTTAGLATARARGRVGARPSSATPEKLVPARELMNEGRLTADEVARVVGTSKATLYYWLGWPTTAGT
jgi:DNA invertase Pin-like site-specific DNA recombinase